MNNDLISREAVLEYLKRSKKWCEDQLDVGEFRKGCIAAIDDDMGNIRSTEVIPAVDAVEVVHGHWTLMGSGTGVCSKCHRTTVAVWDMDNVLKYCPHCGARMDGE